MKLKLFISYSHEDEDYVRRFVKHIAPLKDNGLIEDWYDRKLIAGKVFQDHINNNLNDADIICLSISANFLSSPACMEEKKNAFDLLGKKGLAVLPIILSPCGWLDDKDISSLLALPTDGKAILDFPNLDSGWNDVYKGLKILIDNEIKVKQLSITDTFSDFLKNTSLLTKAHSQKERVFLEDIFIYPEVSKFDDLKEYEKKFSSAEIVDNFYDYKKIIIAGENQSGKTTLCKKLFLELRKKNFIPIYIFDKAYTFHGRMENRIAQAYKEQYSTIPITAVPKDRIVPIIDDFHFAKNKEKHIADLAEYRYQVLIVDDIFSLNFRDERFINSFIYFKIEELNPLLRDQLIKKWAGLTDKEDAAGRPANSFYQLIDERTELINATLGKLFGKGIMPAYPFFLLSIICTYDTFAKPLDQEITSQGYCYQAFIYMYLRKQGVKNEDIDTYINFLDHFAFLFFTKNRNEISPEEFNSFMKSYMERFNLPINKDTLIEKLRKANIIAVDNFNNYSFFYPYLYYFFVAKYLAENMEDNKEKIGDIINNLHKNENAYVAVFICHHSKNDTILEELILNVLCLFDKYKPATLTDRELKFFDKQAENLVQAVLPPARQSPEVARKERLEKQKNFEERQKKEKGEEKEKGKEIEDENEELANELRRSIKTVEVIGTIIKNRAGSLDKEKLKSMFEEAMNVHLRILSSFLELIGTEKDQEEIIGFLATRVKMITDKIDEERRSKGKKQRELPKEKLEIISKTIFWNINFFTIYGLVIKIITSLGSAKLTEIVRAVCDNKNTPVAHLIKHGILMWYNKNLQVDVIAEDIEKDGFSKIAERIMKFLIVDYCSVHKINFRERQKIEQKFHIPSQKLLECQQK